MFDTEETLNMDADMEMDMGMDGGTAALTFEGCGPPSFGRAPRLLGLLCSRQHGRRGAADRAWSHHPAG